MKKGETITYYKNFQLLKQITDNAIRQGMDFELHHGTYTTQIVFPETGNKFQFITDKHDERVFVAHRLILRDLQQVQDKVRHICSTMWPTDNYDSRNGLKPFRNKSVYNLDISSCYATTLRNTGLISPETFAYLQKLPKLARLPAIGMLAKNKIIYQYRNGELVDFQPDQSQLAPIFYYVVNYADKVMKECAFWLKDYFVFYWVDGIFFQKDAPPFCVDTCIEIMDKYDYAYKWENVQDFSCWRVEDKIHIDMVKNGQRKQQVFADKNFSRNFNNTMNGWLKEQKQRSVVGDF